MKRAATFLKKDPVAPRFIAMAKNIRFKKKRFNNSGILVAPRFIAAEN